MPVAYMRFKFPVPIGCRPDLLGVRSRIALPGIPAVLCLPVELERKVGFEGSFGPPRLRDMKWFVNVMEHVEPGLYDPWGHYGAGGPREDQWVGYVTSAVLRVNASTGTRKAVMHAAQQVHESIDGWYSLLRDWVEVLTEQDLEHEHPYPSVLGRAAVETAAWIYRGGSPSSPQYDFFNPPGIIRMPGGDPLTRSLWQTAVRRANAGTSPPDAYLLLRDARAALHRQVTRRVVLDTATAVEVVLVPLLDDRISRSLGSAASMTLLPKRQPISAKIPILQSIGVTLPATLQDDVFGLRNRVIHNGYSPTIAEARAALQTGTAAVAQHCPLR